MVGLRRYKKLKEVLERRKWVFMELLIGKFIIILKEKCTPEVANSNKFLMKMSSNTMWMKEEREFDICWKIKLISSGQKLKIDNMLNSFP